MQAIWLDNRRLSLRDDLPLPEPVRGEALIRVRLAGLCGTDLELARGYYPFTGIPGHEFVGEVVHSENPQWLGQRVVGEINIACGHCEACRKGRKTHCENRSVLGIRDRAGAFARYLALPEENLHPVPEGVADEAAVFTEPLAAALEIQEQIALRPHQRVLLIGAGRLGQLIAQTLALTACELLVSARHPRQRQLLAGRGIILIEEADIPSHYFDVVIEATGSPGGFALARKAVRPRGILVLKSTYRGGIHLDLSALVVDEITLLGSRCGPFPAALRLLEYKRVDPAALIEAEYSLDRGIEAFEQAGQPGTLKILLRLL